MPEDEQFVVQKWAKLLMGGKDVSGLKEDPVILFFNWVPTKSHPSTAQCVQQLILFF